MPHSPVGDLASSVIAAYFGTCRDAGDRSYFANIRESIISSIATEAKSHDGGVIAYAATTLGGNLDRLKVLSPNEQNLLHEWLNRLLASSSI